MHPHEKDLGMQALVAVGPVCPIDQQQNLHTHQGDHKPGKELHPIGETVELHDTRAIATATATAAAAAAVEQ